MCVCVCVCVCVFEGKVWLSVSKVVLIYLLKQVYILMVSIIIKAKSKIVNIFSYPNTPQHTGSSHIPLLPGDSTLPPVKGHKNHYVMLERKGKCLVLIKLADRNVTAVFNPRSTPRVIDFVAKPVLCLSVSY